MGEYVGPYHLNTLNDVVALSKTLTRFTRGLLDTDLKQLCGLNTKLLRLLRAGDHITERLSGSVDPRPIDPAAHTIGVLDVELRVGIQTRGPR